MSVPITVVIPTYKRIDKLQVTLARIRSCHPQPAEILVHVDGDDEATVSALADASYEISVLRSRPQVGPGESRNKLIKVANNPLIAGFDDDSYPLDLNYFERLTNLFAEFPQAAIIAAKIYQPHQPLETSTDSPVWVANYTGCGCAYRKDVFQQTTGHVQRLVPYGIEENDLALRLHALGWGILEASVLRVFHDTTLTHHISPSITTGVISNVALHAFLRYPISYWGYGLLQCLNQVRWQLHHGRRKGILQGLAAIPTVIWQHRYERQPVPVRYLRSYLQFRYQKVPAHFGQNFNMYDRTKL